MGGIDGTAGPVLRRFLLECLVPADARCSAARTRPGFPWVLRAENQQVVKALAAKRAPEPLREGVFISGMITPSCSATRWLAMMAPTLAAGPEPLNGRAHAA